MVRVSSYRDEMPGAWEEFIAAPVKRLLENFPALSAKNESIIDVWDRQFLTVHFRKAPAQSAEIFVVSMWIQEKFFADLLELNGEKGCYVEPRSNDGRQTDSNFRVIWVPHFSLRRQVGQRHK